MWDAVQEQEALARRPAGTVATVAQQDERHTKRHPRKRTGGVKTSKLGSVQRRVLMNVFHAAWDKAHAVDPPLDPTDVWVPWDPQEHADGTSKSSGSTVSTALAALEKGRLLLVRRHKVRAHAVRLSGPGWDQAIELVTGQGRTRAEARKRLADGLPAEVRHAAFAVNREMRMRGVSSERMAVLKEFDQRYRDYINRRSPPDGIVGLMAAFEALRQVPGRNVGE